MSELKGKTGTPANGGNHHKRKSVRREKVVIAGKEYPVVGGGIKMDRIDAENISLSDFPSDSIVEFPDEGTGFHVQAIQKITKTGAEWCLLTRNAPDNPILLDHGLHFGLATNLIQQRAKKRKDIKLLLDHHCKHGHVVSAVTPCTGRTVGAVVKAGMKVFSDTLSGLESIENGIARRIQHLEEKELLPGASMAVELA